MSFILLILTNFSYSKCTISDSKSSKCTISDTYLTSEWSNVEFLLQLLYKWEEVLMNLRSEIFGSNFCKLWGLFVIKSSCGLDWC